MRTNMSVVGVGCDCPILCACSSTLHPLRQSSPSLPSASLVRVDTRPRATARSAQSAGRNQPSAINRLLLSIRHPA
ncbi:hypothetical protein BST61_g361 [Cercospora zeina]